MKRLLCILAALCLLIPACLSGCGEKTEGDTGYYKSEVLDDLTRGTGSAEKLPGMAEGLCVITDEGLYDKKLIDAGAAGLFSEDDLQVLYAKNARKKMYPASLTKVMTALLVLESGLPMSEEIRVGSEVSEFTDSSSLAGLKEGSSYSVEELLTALLVPSGNDAASALAVAVAGSVDAFVEKMNGRAAELGMLGTHFANPHGLHDKNHYTTVYDLYLLTREACTHPEFLRIASLMEGSITGTDSAGQTETLSYKSTNSYLRNYTVPPEGLTVRASKTGYTGKAGRCLILYVTDTEGKRYFGILMNADTYDELYIQMNALLTVIGQ